MKRLSHGGILSDSARIGREAEISRLAWPPTDDTGTAECAFARDRARIAAHHEDENWLVELHPSGGVVFKVQITVAALGEVDDTQDLATRRRRRMIIWKPCIHEELPRHVQQVIHHRFQLRILAQVFHHG